MYICTLYMYLHKYVYVNIFIFSLGVCVCLFIYLRIYLSPSMCANKITNTDTSTIMLWNTAASSILPLWEKCYKFR